MRMVVNSAFNLRGRKGFANLEILGGEGEVLAGEAGPDDVAVGNGAAADLLDGAEVEMAGAVVGGVDGGLLRADVVRPDGGAGVLGSLGDKAAAGKEIDEGWKGGVQEFF